MSKEHRILVPSGMIWIGMAVAAGCQPTPSERFSSTERPKGHERLESRIIVSPSCKNLPDKEKDSQNINIDCSTSNCGGNSPIVNRFPVNGLNPGGCENAQHIKLVPNSVYSSDPSSPCNGKTLDVDKNGKLFAGDPIKCGDQRLHHDHASFLIEKDHRSYAIAIEFFGFVNKYPEDDVHGYIFRWQDTQKSLCDTETSFQIQEELKILNKEDKSWSILRSPIYKTQTTISIEGLRVNDSDIAIVLSGEIRDKNSDIFEESKESGWFNIACKRDALAKIDLDGISPAKASPAGDPDYYDRRTSALKMVTANYCGTSRYTYEGNDIEWEYPGPIDWLPRGGIAPLGTREAVWNKDGAVCLEHTRLHHLKFKLGTIPKEIAPKQCLDRDCRNEMDFRNAIYAECPSIKHDCSKIGVDYSEDKKSVYFRSYSR